MGSDWGFAVGDAKYELAERGGLGGAPAAALRWLTFILVDENIQAAWAMTDADLRLAICQQMLHTNEHFTPQQRRALAAEFAREEPQGEKWSDFAPALLRRLTAAYGQIDLQTWGTMRPRPVDPEHELVVLAPAPGGGRVIQPDEQFVGAGLLLRWDGCWLIAGLGDCRPTPGWPPDFHQGPVAYT